MFHKGEISSELKSKMKELGITGRIDTDHFIVSYPCSDEESIQRFLNNHIEARQITPELAIESYKISIEREKVIKKFLTPEKQAELTKLFSKK
ncbi:MAG: hypothetical protein ABFD07_00060 [Methanobacterium sp.]